MYALKRFESVETILQPLLKKYSTTQGDFTGTIRRQLPIAGDWSNKSQLKDAITYLDSEFMKRYNTVQQVYEAWQQMTAYERHRFFTDPAPIRCWWLKPFAIPPKTWIASLKMP